MYRPEGLENMYRTILTIQPESLHRREGRIGFMGEEIRTRVSGLEGMSQQSIPAFPKAPNAASSEGLAVPQGYRGAQVTVPATGGLDPFVAAGLLPAPAAREPYQQAFLLDRVVCGDK